MRQSPSGTVIKLRGTFTIHTRFTTNLIKETTRQSSISLHNFFYLETIRERQKKRKYLQRREEFCCIRKKRKNKQID